MMPELHASSGIRVLLILNFTTMTDRKTTFNKRRPKRKGSRRNSRIPRSPGFNAMIYRTRWNYGVLTSTTAGNISAGNMSPSIVSSSESSQLAALFGEIKLLAATFMFTSKATSLSTVAQGRLMIGTDMYTNASNPVTPTNITFVQNLANPATLGSSAIRPFRYRMVVPSLEFSVISSDAPSPATPWAGSPGNVRVWGDAFTPSTVYFDVDVIAIYWLRARQ